MNASSVRNAMSTSLQLLLLPERPDAAVVRLQVDAEGWILARETITTDGASTVAAGHDAARQVLAVPGSDCLALWLRLPARNPVQALAAARVLVEGHVAASAGALHLAIAAPSAADEERLVVAVEPARMQDWLDRAAALGMTPDVVVPMPLLLPEPDATDGADDVVAGNFDGQALVRGAQLAFAGEPGLAAHVIGERTVRTLDHAATEAALAAGALSPPIDLLQYEFARTAPRREGWPAWRRAAILAGVLAATPLVLLAAQVLQYELSACDLQAQARAQARTVLPQLADEADPLPAIRAQLSGLQAGDRFGHAVGALLSAVASSKGAELDALAYADGIVQATLVVDAPARLEHVRAALAAAGLEMTATGSQGAGGRLRHDITIGPGT